MILAIGDTFTNETAKTFIERYDGMVDDFIDAARALVDVSDVEVIERLTVERLLTWSSGTPYLRGHADHELTLAVLRVQYVDGHTDTATISVDLETGDCSLTVPNYSV